MEIQNGIDVFSLPASAVIFESYFDEEILPQNSLDLSAPVIFNFMPLQKVMRNTGQLQIYAKLQVLKKDGSEYKDSDKMQGRLSDNIVCSLFKGVKFYINNVLIYNIDNLFSHRCHIESICNFSQTSSEGQMEISGLFHNVERLEKATKNSVIVDFIARLPLIQLQRLIVPNTSISIHLMLNSSDFILVEKTKKNDDDSITTTTESLLKIIEIKTYIRSYILRDAYAAQLEKSMHYAGGAIYQYKAVQMIHYNIPKGTTNFAIPSLYSGIKPELALAFFLNSKQFNGDLNEDSFVYNHYNIQTMSFVVDNVKYPRTPYIFSFKDSQKLYARALSDIYTTIQLREKNEAIQISRETYEKLFVVLQDLTTSAHALTTLASLIQLSNLSVEIVFSSALEESISLVLYIVVPAKFTIKPNRNIEINY